MDFEFNAVEYQRHAAEDYSKVDCYADFTDVFYKDKKNGKFDRNIIETKGYLCNDQANPFYILNIDRYLKSLQPLGPSAYKYNHTAVIVVTSIDDEADLSAFEGMPIEYMPILVFQHHEGPMQGVSNGVQHTIDETFQRENGFLNDTVLFKGVFKAIATGDNKYRLEKIWNRFYL